MIPTGQISFLLSQELATTTNEWGQPVLATATWSDFYPCNLHIPRREFKLYQGGQYREVGLVALVDLNELGSTDVSASMQVKVNDSRGNAMSKGEYQVLSNSLLRLTRQVQIMVSKAKGM